MQDPQKPLLLLTTEAIGGLSDVARAITVLRGPAGEVTAADVVDMLVDRFAGELVAQVARETAAAVAADRRRRREEAAVARGSPQLLAELAQLIGLWLDAFGQRPMTTTEVARALLQASESPLQEATLRIRMWAALRGLPTVTAVGLGKLLSRYECHVVTTRGQRMRLSTRRTSRGVEWRVVGALADVARTPVLFHEETPAATVDAMTADEGVGGDMPLCVRQTPRGANHRCADPACDGDDGQTCEGETTGLVGGGTLDRAASEA